MLEAIQCYSFMVQSGQMTRYLFSIPCVHVVLEFGNLNNPNLVSRVNDCICTPVTKMLGKIIFPYIVISPLSLSLER